MKMQGSILPMSTLLPQHARDALIAASKVESRIDIGESPERAAAIEDAIVYAREAHPEMFQ